MTDKCTQDEICGTDTPICRLAFFACKEVDTFERKLRDFGIDVITEVEYGQIKVTINLNKKENNE